LRVAIVHEFYRSNQPSGENEVVLAEAAALARAGIACAVISPSGTGQLSPWSAGLSALRGGSVDLEDELSSFDPDVVHVHNTFPSISRSALSKVASPLVLTLHNYRHFCVNGLLFRQGRICHDCLGSSLMKGVIHSCYRSRPASAAVAVDMRRRGKDVLLERADHLLCLSATQESIVRAQVTSPDRVLLSPHFVPDDLVSASTQLVDAVGEDYYFVASRLGPEKGVARLVDVWPRAAPLLVIAGEGADERMLAHRPRNVVLIGRKPRVEVLKWVRRARAVIVPSLWYETFGLVQIEAMAHGVPTIAFRPNVVAERIADEGVGVVADWEEDLVDVLRRFESSADELAEACVQTFSAKYSEASFITRRRKLYSEAGSKA
jgi:glycosyltransferase involved in cell wall biosynthesis